MKAVCWWGLLFFHRWGVFPVRFQDVLSLISMVLFREHTAMKILAFDLGNFKTVTCISVDAGFQFATLSTGRVGFTDLLRQLPQPKSIEITNFQRAGLRLLG